MWDCAPLTPTCDIKGNAINPAGWFDENLNNTVFHAVTFGLLTSRKEAGYTCVCGSDDLGNATASGVGFYSFMQGEGIETCLEFWGLNVPMILLTVVLEIYLLGFAALRSSWRARARLTGSASCEPKPGSTPTHTSEACWTSTTRTAGR